MKSNASPAESTLRIFSLFYLILCLLSITVLPQYGLWYYLWRIGGMAAFAAATALCFVSFAKSRADRTSSEPAWSPKHPETLICAVWFVWSCAACLITAKGDLGVLRYNSTYLFDLGVSLLLLFPFGRYLGRNDKTGFLDRCIDFTGVFCGALLVFALCLMFTGRSVELFGRFYGLNDDGRLCLGTNPNTTGACTLFFFWAGVYRLYTAKSRARKWFISVFCLMNMMGLVFSDSRTSMVAMAAAAVIYAIVLLFRRIKSSVGRAALIVLCVLAFSGALFLGYLLLTGRGPVLGARAKSIATLSGRTIIWKAVAEREKSDPHLLLFGVSPALVIPFVQDLLHIDRSLNTHNQFLEILVGQGAPALILFTIWLCFVLKKSVRLSFAPETERRRVLPLILAALLIGNLGEATLVCLQNYTGSMFFLIAGYVCGVAEGSAFRASV